MEYKEVELKKSSNKFYFPQPKNCYCSKDIEGTDQRMLPDKTICMWCSIITEKISEIEDVLESRIVGKKEKKYKRKEGVTKTCKLKNENLFY